MKSYGIQMKSSGSQLKSDFQRKSPETPLKSFDIHMEQSDISFKEVSGRKHSRNTDKQVEERQQKELTEEVSKALSANKLRNQMPETSEKQSLSFVCLSDTHCKLTEEVISQIPHADVLLHAGDFTMNGTVRELLEFNKFLGLLSHTFKVVIAGNHEACLEDDLFPETRLINNHYRNKFGVKEIRDLLTNCIFLQDELTEICGIKICGSPWTPEYSVCYAFSLSKSEDLLEKWGKIPDNVDILLTHGPPRGFGDTTLKHVSAGCSSLLQTVQNRIKPKYHVFGHIHEGYGVYKDEVTTYINAATCTRGYKPTNRPIKFQVNIPKQISGS